MENRNTLKKKSNLNHKLLICYNAPLYSFSQNKNNQFFTNYSEISQILKSNLNDLLCFIYLNRHNINEILYDEEKYIKIEIKEENKSLVNYFFLDLLINDNKQVVNYIYPIKLIDDLNNYQESIEKNLKYKKMIVAKIILDLINNYKNYEEYDKKYDEKLNFIEEINNEIINMITKTEEIIGNWDAKYLQNKNIDEIYIDIIKALFQQNNFRNIEKILNILKQLDLESINITEKMIKEFSQIFGMNSNFIKNFMIKDAKDLININKIKFYSLMFKYIFKESIFLYQIPFLFKTRTTIINLINNKLGELSFINIENDIKKEIEYILEIITDSKFYYSKYVNYHILPKLNPILKYYKNYLFESKKEDIILIEREMKGQINNAYKFLNDYEKAIKMNERFEIINFLFEQKIKNVLLTEKELDKCVKEWEILEIKIKEQKFEDISKEDIQILEEFLNNAGNKKIFTNIFTKDLYKSIKDLFNSKETKEDSKDLDSKEAKEENEQYYISSSSSNKTNSSKGEESIYLPIRNHIQSKGENNINKKNKYSFQDSSESKKSDEKSGENSKQSSSNIISNKKYKIESDDSDDSDNSDYDDNSDDFDNSKKYSYHNDIPLNYYSILKFIKIIGKHENTSEIIKEINEQKIISCGQFDINIYENNYKYEKIQEYKDLGCINNVEEFEFLSNIKLNIFVSTKEHFSLINLRTKKIEKITGNHNINFCLKTDNSTMMVCQNDQIMEMKNPFCKILQNNNSIIKEGYYKEGICINKKLFAFTSNRVVSNGEDKIIFYNKNVNNICREIRNYSFILSSTGLYLITMDNLKKDQVLLCACKKYLKGQKNGILLVWNLESMKNDKNKNIKFYNTKDFEVHCFCQLNENEENNSLFNANPKKSNYFFVGGFDTRKRKGILKLYKINEKNDAFDIEEIYDLSLEDDLSEQGQIFSQSNVKKKNISTRLNGPYSCIEQTKNNGNILISCWDGKIYLFEAPNLKLIQTLDKNINIKLMNIK